MATIFSEILAKFRKEAGFKTAYQFFHDNGGKPVLKVSYRMYLLIEQGKLLPPFKNISLYIYALRLSMRSYSAMELIAAWLKTALGEDDFKHILQPFLKVPQEQSIPSALHKAVKTSLIQKKFYIKPEQMQVIVKNRGTYLCWTALSNDTGAWVPKALAAEMGLSPSAAQNALRDLAAAKLVRRRKDGAYKCPMAGGMVEYPHGTITQDTPDIRNKFQQLRDEMISSGDMVYRRRGILRASLTEFANCFPLLALNVSTAATYAITKKQKDSALFAVECKVVRIRDF